MTQVRHRSPLDLSMTIAEIFFETKIGKFVHVLQHYSIRRKREGR
jgi:hypothetical protein